jgi:hypothetical protein
MITVNGKVEVVGVGYHTGKGSSAYDVSFPLAGVKHNGGPSPNIKDPRK